MRRTTVKVRCGYCRSRFDKVKAYVTRAEKLGMEHYCNRVCFGLGSRVEKTAEQKKREKRLYDIRYRQLTDEKRRQLKREYYAAKKTEPGWREKERLYRQRVKERHLAYCRKYYSDPANNLARRLISRKSKNKKVYGEFWEAAYVSQLINDEVRSRMSAYEVRMLNGTQNKALMRSRNGEIKRGYT